MNSKKKHYILFFLLLVFLFISCSSIQGPLFKSITNVPENQSVIYIYRSNDKTNSEFAISCNDKELGMLENNQYLPELVNEGKVVIKSMVQFKMFTTGLLDAAIADSTIYVFKAEPGKSYYIECKADEFSGQVLTIDLVPENYGSNRIKNCVLVQQEN